MVISEIDVLTQYSADVRWFSSNIKELRSKYEEKYVAISKSKVVAEAETIEGINKILDKKKELEGNNVFVQFIPKAGLVALF